MSDRPTPSNPKKPWPQPPRTEEDSKSSQVYALLVGINAYEDVRFDNADEPTDLRLNGCVKDVEQVEGFLKDQYQERAKIAKLTDKEATYQNVIDTFKSHLINGGGTSNDTYWFHFSGHGSQQFTANEFFEPQDPEGNPLPSIAPNGKDQTLVCYNPGGALDGIFLADKELAVLISEIHSTVEKVGNTTPHILISLDCCHSGSGTRDTSNGIKKRKLEFLDVKKRSDVGEKSQAGSVRSFSTYYGYRDNEHRGHQVNLKVPHSQHLLLSACSNLELAGDSSMGGVFTTNLIQSLKEAGEKGLNYVELFTRTRANVKRADQEQTPQFEPIGNFNPYTAVIDGYAKGDPGRYEVLKKNGKWYVRAGAVNGLPVDRGEGDDPSKEEKTQVLIYTARDLHVVAHARVGKVGVQDSLLEEIKGIRTDSNGNIIPSDNDLELIDSENEHYVAEVYALPAAPLYIRLRGESGPLEALKSVWASREPEGNATNLDHLSIHFVEGDEAAPDAPIVEIVCEEQEGEVSYTFNNLMDPSLNPWHLVKGNDAVKIVKENLEKVAKWQRMIELENEQSKLQNLYDLEILTVDMPGWEAGGNPDPGTGDFIQIMNRQIIGDLEQDEPARCYKMVLDGLDPANGAKKFFVDGEGFDAIPFVFRVHSKEPKKALYFYLYDMLPNCSISFQGEKDLKEASEGVHDLTEGLKSLRMSHDQQEGVFWFKLFVTRQPIQKEALTQKGFQNTRRTSVGIFSLAGDTEDWHATTLKIVLSREPVMEPA